jgi:MFS family permease
MVSQVCCTGASGSRGSEPGRREIGNSASLESLESFVRRATCSTFYVPGSLSQGEIDVVSGRTGFFALLTADLTTTLGTFVSAVAIPWLVLVNTHSPAKMGAVAAAEMVPFLLASVFGPPLADRFGIKLTSVATDAGAALAMGLIAATPRIGFLPLVLLVAVTGALRGVGDRTKHVLLRPMAGAAGISMVRVTGAYETLNRGAQLIGGPVGGLMIYWFGANGAVWVDAASFAICAAVVAVLVHPPAEETAGEAGPERYLPALRGGVDYLWHNRALLAMLCTFFVVNVLNQAGIAVFVPLWIAEVVNSPAALGLVSGAFAVGAALGSIAFTVLAPKLPPVPTFVAGILIGTAPRLFVLGLSHSLAVVLVVTFLSGVVFASANPILGVTLFEQVPPALQTRVFGLVGAVCLAGLPLGGVLAGWATSVFPLHIAILLIALLCLGLNLVTLRWYRTASLRQPVAA